MESNVINAQITARLVVIQQRALNVWQDTSLMLLFAISVQQTVTYVRTAQPAQLVQSTIFYSLDNVFLFVAQAI
jgi:hypothetical protein